MATVLEDKLEIAQALAAPPSPPPKAPVVSMRTGPSKLPMGRSRERQYAMKDWVFSVPAAVKPEDVLAPVYLIHYARDLSPNDTILFQSEDGLWEMETRVEFIAASEIRVAVRKPDKDGIIRYGMTAESPDSEYGIKWISPPKKWGVVRKDNNSVLKDGLSKPEAETFLREHLQAHR